MTDQETFLSGKLVRVSKDGDQFCALYGKDLQEGVTGFGAVEVDALQELFKALGQEGAVRWMLSEEPDVYLGGGVWMSLPKAICRYEIDRVEAASAARIAKLEARLVVYARALLEIEKRDSSLSRGPDPIMLYGLAGSIAHKALADAPRPRVQAIVRAAEQHEKDRRGVTVVSGAGPETHYGNCDCGICKAVREEGG